MKCHFPFPEPDELLPWARCKSNWDPCKISQTRAALIVSGRLVSLGLSNWQAWRQPAATGQGPFNPMEGISRTAEGKS